MPLPFQVFVPVIAGAGSNNTAEGIRLIRHAEKVGATAALVVTLPTATELRDRHGGLIAQVHISEQAVVWRSGDTRHDHTLRGVIARLKVVLDEAVVPVVVRPVAPSQTWVSPLWLVVAMWSEANTIRDVRSVGNLDHLGFGDSCGIRASHPSVPPAEAQRSAL
jgi:hypothetical protein